MNLKLNTVTGDLDITNNAFTLVEGVDDIRQDWQSRLQTFMGEWFLDQRIGIPYFQEVYVKQPNLMRLRAVFHEVTIGTPGIKEVTFLNLNLDSNRRLTLDVDGKTEDLDTFQFTYNEMVLSQPGAVE